MDPQAQAVLAQRNQAGGPPMSQIPPQVIRDAMAQERAKWTPKTPEMHRIDEVEIPGPEGPIPARLYYPTAAESLPILVYYHGGGWVLGDLDYADLAVRGLAAGAECIVVNVDYRLAPEHPFPAAIDDSYAAYVWAVQNGERFGGDPSRLAIGGDSAGGNLAAVVSQLACDRGSNGPLRHQLLVYPVVDAARTQPSYQENGDYILTEEVMDLFWDSYVPEASRRAGPMISPANAESLEGLAPAHVITAEYDPLRDEGNAYADALAAAGVPVVHKCYAGQIHTFFVDPHLYDVGAEAVTDAARELKSAFEA